MDIKVAEYAYIIRPVTSFRQRMHGIHRAAAVLYPAKLVLSQHGFRAYADGMTVLVACLSLLSTKVNS